jgi:hypothetical protein
LFDHLLGAASSEELKFRDEVALAVSLSIAVSAVIVRSCSDGSRTYRGSIVRTPMHSPVNPRNAPRCERATDTSVSFVDGDNDGPCR